jgi:hypothetical protein
VPTPIPVTVPDVNPIIATDVFPLTQLPPNTVLDKVVLLPSQTSSDPVIEPADAEVVTVTVVVVVTVPQAPVEV